MVYSGEITVETKGFSDIKDITSKVSSIVSKSKIKDGLVGVFVFGATGSVSTIEYEPALVEDMKELLEEFVSSNRRSRHSETWGDDNGFSHMRATFMGPGITVPLSKGSLVLGQWQQIIIIDHDNRARSRKIFIQVVGE